MDKKNKIRFAGVSKAARCAEVSRQQIWLVCTGERNPSPRVAEAIKKYVVAYVPIRPADKTSMDDSEQTK